MPCHISRGLVKHVVFINNSYEGGTIKTNCVSRRGPLEKHWFRTTDVKWQHQQQLKLLSHRRYDRVGGGPIAAFQVLVSPTKVPSIQRAVIPVLTICSQVNLGLPLPRLPSTFNPRITLIRSSLQWQNHHSLCSFILSPIFATWTLPQLHYFWPYPSLGGGGLHS